MRSNLLVLVHESVKSYRCLRTGIGQTDGQQAIVTGLNDGQCRFPLVYSRSFEFPTGVERVFSFGHTLRLLLLTGTNFTFLVAGCIWQVLIFAFL